MPMISKRIKYPSQPHWITSGILVAIHERDKCKKQDNHIHNKRMRNRVLTLVRNSERKFYINAIEQNKKSPKELWNNIKEFCPNKKIQYPSRLTII